MFSTETNIFNRDNQDSNLHSELKIKRKRERERERERERTVIAISNICKRWLLVDDESCVNTPHQLPHLL